MSIIFYWFRQKYYNLNFQNYQKMILLNIILTENEQS